jgi:two-component system NtrC family sensor kinase
MPVVETIKDRCKRCYSCVRNCPAKAISVEQGQAKVIQERCIACGLCVRVCTQNAKNIESGIPETLRILNGQDESFAIVAPSFPAAFPKARPNQVVGALKLLGFTNVLHVALGADLIARDYAQLISRGSMPTVISTPCPALVNYIEKYHPALLLLLAPIVSPMIATGRFIRTHLNPEAKIVFIGPCIAKKKEKNDRNVAHTIDEVLTYQELKQLFLLKNIVVEQCAEERFNPPYPYMGGIFPVSGGLLRTAQISADILKNDIIITEGQHRVRDILRSVEQGKVEASFLDLLFCEGCINGPAMDNDLSVFIRKDIVANYVRGWVDSEDSIQLEGGINKYSDVNLSRKFTNESIVQKQPDEQDIRNIFARINKFKPIDELNCGACGYDSCREKAIAVFEGRAEVEMCFPYLIEKLQSMNKELLEAQERSIRAAQLASMGELAAGVAHEINNPLAGVLNYVKLMQKFIQLGIDEERIAKFDKYLETMENETVRISEIVKGMLEFARPTEPVVSKISIKELVQKTLFLIGHQISMQNIKISEGYESEALFINADFKQIQQVLLNMIINSTQAMPNGGEISIGARTAVNPHFVAIEIKDTGCGIEKQNLDKIFDPFFTSKLDRKGTGLGLSTAYHIIVKHGGDIKVESEVGKGSKFTLFLPVYDTVHDGG